MSLERYAAAPDDGDEAKTFPGGMAMIADDTVAAQLEAAKQPWLQWYEPGVRATIEVPEQTLPYFLGLNAARYPTRVAIRYFGRTITYRQLEEEVNRFSAALHQVGVRKGDRVGLMLPNCTGLIERRKWESNGRSEAFRR